MSFGQGEKPKLSFICKNYLQIYIENGIFVQMENFSKRLRLVLPLSLVWFIIWIIATAKNPFFWDTVLTSKIAQYFYENGFGNLITPTDLDAGHPPFFQLYLSILWKLFGKSLMISHLAMLPFVYLLVWSFYKISLFFFKTEKQIWLAMFFLCIESTLLAQSTLVSYDVAMVAGFLFGLFAILYKKRDWLYWVLILLALLSVRSVVSMACLFLIDFYFRWKEEKFKLIGFIFPYFIGALALFSWHFYHYSATGWAIFSPSNEWSDQRQVATLQTIVKNILVIGRNVLDNGRFVFWIINAFFILIYLFSKNKINDLKSNIYVVLIIVLVVHVLFFIPFTNPIGHRYLMLIYIIGIWVFVGSIFELKKWKIALLFGALNYILGHFIVYPIPISNGWDSSLAYLNGISLQQSIRLEMDNNKINPNEVFTKFPLAFSQKDLYLIGDTSHFETKNIYKVKYVISSNISNDFQEFECNYINKNFKLIKNLKSNLIFYNFYEKID